MFGSDPEGLAVPATGRGGCLGPARTGEPGCSRMGMAVGKPGAAANAVAPKGDGTVDRTEKREFVASLATVFAQTSMVVVTRNQGLTVA